MHIKSIVIDGFKSYGRRTEITGFDRLFNAITGMNGSGKSNILDAICFLLGISNLSQVRAAEYRDLVFKSGQAGITKATVSIIFDNTDKRHSPVNYENYDEITVSRQVIVGGKHKYMINGVSAQNSKVQDFFRSVQLNVNNPHFLIMQGRVTKVLNMKPIEILGMIEEAAGTKMYEAKKWSTLKTMDKKNAKLAEIDSIINETITPTVEKCKKEKQQYVKLQQITRDLEHSKKIITAFKFYSNELHRNELKETIHVLGNKIEKLEEDLAVGETAVINLEMQIKELEQLKEKQLGEQIKALEVLLQEKTKDEIDASASLKSLKEDLKVEEGVVEKALKSLKRDQKTLADKEKHASKYENLFCELEKDAEQSEEDVKSAMKKLKDAENDVVVTDSGQEGSLLQLLYAKKNELIEAERKISDIEKSMSTNKKELNLKHKELADCESTHRDGLEKLQELKKNYGRLINEMEKANYKEGSYEILDESVQTLHMKIKESSRQISEIELRNPNVVFNYHINDAQFDHGKVKGMVCRLFKVKDIKYATALELVAGSKLYDIVVDTDITSKLLINKGNLQKRVTMIPLNKIQGRIIPDRFLKLAEKKVGQNKVFSALSLIEFDPIYKPAMEYVFGDYFVCTDIEIAKLVTFDNSIHQKCVTIEGDYLNPVGTLSGGYRGKKMPVLAQMASLNDFCHEKSRLEMQLKREEKELHNISKVAKRFNAVKEEAESKKREIDLYEKTLSESQYKSLKDEIDVIQQTIDSNQLEIKNLNLAVKNIPKEIKDLEYKVKNKDSLKKKAVESAKKELETCKKKAIIAKDKWKEKEQEANVMKLEIEALKTSITTEQENIEGCEKKIQEMRNIIVSKEKELEIYKQYKEEASARVKLEKDKIAKQNKEINDLVDKKQSMLQNNSDKALEMDDAKYKLQSAVAEVESVEKYLRNLLNSHKWISDEKQYFGLANSNFDFDSINLPATKEKIIALEYEKNNLSKNVNTRAMRMLEEAEDKYNDLIERKDTVLKDKKKIEAFIKEIDDKKKLVLQAACESVNRDFGSIFSLLLKGAYAKLEPIEGKSALEGLEIKVRFGEIWKESLNELSGGQRSLVALSLVLAMLLFKPAPIYILDEVDAALDLSHTQNIGTMLRTHFTTSQFIVVSLKDGMFNNANVLFKTKFVDGMSTVTRINNRR